MNRTSAKRSARFRRLSTTAERCKVFRLLCLQQTLNRFGFIRILPKVPFACSITSTWASLAFSRGYSQSTTGCISSGHFPAREFSNWSASWRCCVYTRLTKQTSRSGWRASLRAPWSPSPSYRGDSLRFSRGFRSPKSRHFCLLFPMDCRDIVRVLSLSGGLRSPAFRK